MSFEVEFTLLQKFRTPPDPPMKRDSKNVTMNAIFIYTKLTKKIILQKHENEANFKRGFEGELTMRWQVSACDKIQIFNVC